MERSEDPRGAFALQVRLEGGARGAIVLFGWVDGMEGPTAGRCRGLIIQGHSSSGRPASCARAIGPYSAVANTERLLEIGRRGSGC